MTQRTVLPQRRAAETFDLQHRHHRDPYRVTVGYVPGTDQPAEVFVHGPKAGSESEALGRDGAILLSLAMQFGVPLETIRGAITREGNGEPSTIIGAVVDLLCRKEC